MVRIVFNHLGGVCGGGIVESWWGLCSGTNSHLWGVGIILNHLGGFVVARIVLNHLGGVCGGTNSLKSSGGVCVLYEYSLIILVGLWWYEWS